MLTPIYFLVRSVLLIFLVFSVVLFLFVCLRPVSCILNVASVLDCPLLISPSVSSVGGLLFPREPLSQ